MIDERDRDRDPGPGRRQAPCGRRGRAAGTARAAPPARRRNISPTAHSPIADPEQDPVSDPAAAGAPAMERVAGERPERQLDDVVIELGGGEMEVVQAVDDQHRDQRAARADQRQRGRPDQREGRDHRDLRQRRSRRRRRRTPGRRPRPATTAAAAACRSRAAIRGRRSAPRSGRAAGWGRARRAAPSRPRDGERETPQRPPAGGGRSRRSIRTSMQHARWLRFAGVIAANDSGVPIVRSSHGGRLRRIPLRPTVPACVRGPPERPQDCLHRRESSCH